MTTVETCDAEAFLHALDPGDGSRFSFQTFDDSGRERKELARVLHGTLAQHRAELERLNSQGAGVFVMVNRGDGKGRSARNVTGIRALFLDFDLGGEEGQQRLEAAMAATPQPSMVIESSPGKHHVYWLVADCPLNEFTRWQTALASRFGGDPSVKDLPRVMRLPGFAHRKGEPFTTRLIECTGELYTLDQMVQGLGLEATKAAPAAPAAGAGGDAPAVLNRNVTLTSAAGVLRRKGFGEEQIAEALLALNAALYKDPLGAAEVARIAKNVAKYPAGEDWPDPEALPDARLPVPAFDMALLPDVLRPWIEDISERMQCPPDFPAIGAMVSIAAVVGRRIGIRPKRLDDWTVVPNLWGAVVGRPGVLKTPALAEAMRPLEWLAAGAREAHARAMQEHAVTLELTKAHRDRLRAELRKKAQRDEAAIAAELATLAERDGEPAEVRYSTNDPTVEKLGELLAANPAGLLVFRDELTGWLRSLDREGREGDRSFYLEAWNGAGGYTYDRIGRGKVHIEAATVSVLGGIQPGPLAAYVREAASSGGGADGLLQRFQLLVWPDDPTGWRNVDRSPDSSAKSAVFALFERMANLDPLAVGGRVDDGLPYLRFDPEAQEAFDGWRCDLEARLRSGEPEVIEAHLSKYRSLLPSLALLCHLADKPQGGPVTLTAVQRAASWCEYLEAHARRLYAQGIGADYAAAHALASRIRRGDVPDGAKPKDIYLKGWSGLDKEATYRALDVLAESGWLRVERLETGGRPSTVIGLNPKLGEEKIFTRTGGREPSKPSKAPSAATTHPLEGLEGTGGPVPVRDESALDVEEGPCLICGDAACGGWCQGEPPDDWPLSPCAHCGEIGCDCAKPKNKPIALTTESPLGR